MQPACRLGATLAAPEAPPTTGLAPLDGAAQEARSSCGASAPGRRSAAPALGRACPAGRAVSAPLSPNLFVRTTRAGATPPAGVPPGAHEQVRRRACEPSAPQVQR